MPEGKRAGRVALLTGASRGDGRAIAARCAREGAAVAINYITGKGEWLCAPAVAHPQSPPAATQWQPSS